jgi:hypothetical protein
MAEPSKWGHRIVTQMSVTELAADSFAPVAMLCFFLTSLLASEKNGTEIKDSNRLARSCSSSPSLHFTFINFFFLFSYFFVRRRLVQVARWSTHLPSSRLFLFFFASHLLKTTSSLKASRRARGEGLPPGGGDSFLFGWAGGGGRFYSSGGTDSFSSVIFSRVQLVICYSNPRQIKSG